jgi:limonene-1,2-epoxide hydrolase
MSTAVATPTSEELAVAFFARWGESFDETRAAFEETLAPRCLWEQRPIAVTRTREDAIRFLERARRRLGMETIEVEMLNVASTGDTVMTERVDHLRRADGRLIASAPVAGILEFRDGRIAAWREHFDATGFGVQLVRNIVKRRV